MSRTERRKQGALEFIRSNHENEIADRLVSLASQLRKERNARKKKDEQLRDLYQIVRGLEAGHTGHTQ